jgi:hypothetical protein
MNYDRALYKEAVGSQFSWTLIICYRFIFFSVDYMCHYKIYIQELGRLYVLFHLWLGNWHQFLDMY